MTPIYKDHPLLRDKKARFERARNGFTLGTYLFDMTIIHNQKVLNNIAKNGKSKHI